MTRKWIVTVASAATAVVALNAGSRAARPAAARAAEPQISWIVQPSGTDADLRGVSAVDAYSCWASGSKGTVLRTIDGGQTWQTLKIPGTETAGFRDIEAFDKDTAIAISIAGPARFFKTTDGGRAWTEVYHNDAKGIFFDAFAFADARTGFGFGDPVDGRFLVINTQDGGNSWQEVPKEGMPQMVPDEKAFAASGSCLTMRGKQHVWFATGGSTAARVFRSTNGGKAWEAIDSQLSAGITTSGGFSLIFLNDRNGIVVGGNHKDENWTEKNAATTSDGGKTWKLVETRKPSGFREGVAAVPGSRPLLVVTVGLNGSDYSLDLGRSWTPISSASKGFHGVSFAKDGTGWAVGRNGLIAKYSTTPPTARTSPGQR
jgi:photosystem II stability/assembly factor-like uncharacterized protein